eukprot:365296-Chlamydomonas_euryale.AAC.7
MMRLHRALPELARAHSADPASATVLNALGLCTVSLGFIAEGVELYRKAVALKADLVESWMNMGAVRFGDVL